MKIGNADISNVLLGANQVQKIYRGAVEVWSAGGDEVLLYQINCGGAADGAYAADTYGANGLTDIHFGHTIDDTSQITDLPVPPTAANGVLDTLRYCDGANGIYAFPVTSGKTYRIVMFFHSGNGSSNTTQEFDILVEGVTAIANFKPYIEAGSVGWAIAEAIVSGIVADDTTLNIEFNRLVGITLISAIRIYESN